MKKIISLIKACMTSDMNIFKLKAKKSGTKNFLPVFIAFCLMFAIWTNVAPLFEKMAQVHMQHIVLSLVVFSISIITIVEGVYKAGPLIFNCKDDQLLLSLPIKRSTVVFIRIFKFYVFELAFSSLFMIPVVIAYLITADTVSASFFITTIIMFLLLPIIPIVISCFIGAITSSLSSHFKYKNFVQIVVSIIFILGIMYVSFNMDKILNYLMKNAKGVNDLVTKLYYPAGVYAKLAISFNIKDLLLFIIINAIIAIIAIFILSKVYFKINSRLKKVTTTKKSKFKDITIKCHTPIMSLIKKEIKTFFNIPVFIINAGFGLVLFILMVIMMSIKFDSFLAILSSTNGINISPTFIMSNLSILIFALISFTAYMTSITNSVISLEGKNINILKALPIKTKTILMSKIYSSLLLTTPILLVGDLVLFIRFHINISEALLLIVLSILIPLVSHFIGIIINLKYPKLDAENSTEVVKQSTSSFIAVMLGMILFIISVVIIVKVAGKYSSLFIITMATLIYIVIDILLYFYLIKKGTKDFNNLSV